MHNLPRESSPGKIGQGSGFRTPGMSPSRLKARPFVFSTDIKEVLQRQMEEAMREKKGRPVKMLRKGLKKNGKSLPSFEESQKIARRVYRGSQVNLKLRYTPEKSYKQPQSGEKSTKKKST